MEVIFDTPNLRPRLSPTMRTTLSVISLIANSLVEANKCMKERLAEESGPPPTLDQVMQQSGLKIPGLEEALARLMGGGADAERTASMIVNTPDPATLLQMFTAHSGPPPASAKPPPPGPIVTPPPAANNPQSFSTPFPSAAPAAAPGSRLAPFRADFTREAREAAKAAGTSSPSPGLPQFRQDFTPEGRQAAQRHDAGPVQRDAAQAAERLSLVGGVVRQLDAIRRHRRSFEEMVRARLLELAAELAKLREEFNQLRAALLSRAPSGVAETTLSAVCKTADAVVTVMESPAATPDTSVTKAPVIGGSPAVAHETAEAAVGTAATATQLEDASTEEPLPPAATAEEVVEAIGLIEQFAVETQAAEAEQLTRIAAAEREVARMRSLVQSAREARADARA